MNYPKIIENILHNKYLGDSKSGGSTIGEVKILKQKCEEFFKKCCFKWHSNIPTGKKIL